MRAAPNRLLQGCISLLKGVAVSALAAAWLLSQLATMSGTW